MAKNNKMPVIRFSGYTDAWEQCKLSELATMNARIGWQNLRTSEFLDNGDYLLITGTDFDNGRIKYSTCHYVEKKRFDQDTKIQLSTGSILITKDGTLGKVALVEELPKPATLNAGVFNVRVKDDAFLSYKYLYHYLKAPFLMKYVTANATGGTIKHLNQSILVDFPIPITEKPEQDRIAKLLDSLESIITLHQRKLEKLKLTKKALLQKLFPQNESKFPELRFKGFADAWEQRKLGEVVKSYSGGTPTASNKEYYGGDIPFIRSAEINSDTTELYITQKGLDNSSAKIVEKGTILYAMYGATSGEVGISKINGAINQAILAMIPLDYNGKIIAQYLRKNKESIIGKYLQGGQGNLSANIILELPIQLPGLEESNQIANFLESFDKIITLHQRKLEMLKSIKKGLLQKIFV